MADKFFLGENAQSFRTSPKFDTVDMVILNLDENTYISSPYVKLDEDIWNESWQRKYNGKYVFSYDTNSSGWKQTAGPAYYSSSVVDLEDFGITTGFTVESALEKAGDTITVNRFAETQTSDNPEPQVQITIELKRTGRTIEADCPLCKPDQRQTIADNLLETLSGYQYQPYTASSAALHPLAELGDAVTLHGIYGGLYQQELDFNSMMTSDIGAPGEEETDHEFTYETASERNYSRKFADISAEFEIHATEIAARVTKEGTGDGFSWSLVYDGFSVNTGNKTVFLVDKNGASVEGTIKATDGIIGGFTIGANSIYKDIDTFGSDDKYSGVYLGTNGIQLGKAFKVTSSGAVTASNLTISGGSINLGEYNNNGTADYRFKVTNGGYVYATSLFITGGSINIGNGNFRVDTNGNLYATSGTFSGNVYAKNIKYSGDYGTFSGAGLTPNSIAYGSGGALGFSWYSGAVGGNNFGDMTTQNYTANWVVANHILCYSGGNISGTHYGAIMDRYERSEFPFWSYFDRAYDVSINSGATWGYYVVGVDGYYHSVYTYSPYGWLDFTSTRYMTY